MSRLTLTERQLRALYSQAQASVILPGSRLPIAQQREVRFLSAEESVFDVSDETHLTREEQMDMYERLAEYLFPKNREEHEHSIRVVR